MIKSTPFGDAGAVLTGRASRAPMPTNCASRHGQSVAGHNRRAHVNRNIVCVRAEEKRCVLTLWTIRVKRKNPSRNGCDV